MIQIASDAATIALLLFVSVGALLFHRRVARLRDALAEAGQILPKLDAAVARMNDAAGGFSARIQAEMGAVEEQVSGARRFASDLATTIRDAESLATRLEGQLRQVKRMDSARARAVPRELAEPKGFAERVGRLTMAETAEPGAAVADAEIIEPVPALPGLRRERIGVLSTGAFNSLVAAS